MDEKRFKNRRIYILILIFILAVVVASLDKAGHFLKLYWSLWWFDIIMHFLGGFLVGMGSAWFYGYVYRKTTKNMILFALYSALLVGIFWEIYEIYIGIQPTSEPYPLDTSIDIIMDLAGAYFAGVLVKYLLGAKKLDNKYNNE